MTSNGTYTVEQIKNDHISSRNVKQIMCNEQKNDSKYGKRSTYRNKNRDLLKTDVNFLSGRLNEETKI